MNRSRSKRQFIEKLRTGSPRAGHEIGISAAARVIPVTLGLGEKPPDVIFAGADLAVAAKGAVRGIPIDGGQACIARSRILVERRVLPDFTELLRKELATLKTGSLADCHVGPIITSAQFDRVCEFPDLAREEGAPLIRGGSAVAGEGYFVEPPLDTTFPGDSRLVEEEIFGPVGVVIPFDTEEDALRIANDTPFVPVAGLWTRDLACAHRVERALQA